MSTLLTHPLENENNSARIIEELRLKRLARRNRQVLDATNSISTPEKQPSPTPITG